MKVSSEEFISIWNSSSSVQEVSDRTGLCMGSVYIKRNKLSNELKMLEHFPSYSISNSKLVDNGFGYWLCGLIDGEGHLLVRIVDRTHVVNNKEYSSIELSVGLQITLRNDDKSTLEYVLNNLECGHITTRRMKHRWNPVCDYRVRKTADIIYRIIPIVDCCGLKTKKSKEFEMWKEVAYIKHNMMVNRKNNRLAKAGTRLPDNDIARINEIIDSLRSMRHV